MAIVKYNNYMPQKDVASLSANVSKDLLGIDKSNISVNFSTSPATVTIIGGSIIECNGDLYLIDSDEIFIMSNVAHEYITFNGITFSSAAIIGAWDTEKQGYYNGIIRTLNYYIDQDMSEYKNIILFLKNNAEHNIILPHIKIGLSANYALPDDTLVVIPFDVAYFDDYDLWDHVQYRFTAIAEGYYIIDLEISYESITSTYLGPLWIGIRKNGQMSLDIFPNHWPTLCGSVINPYTSSQEGGYLQTITHLEIGDYIDFTIYDGVGTDRIISGEISTFASISKLTD